MADIPSIGRAKPQGKAHENAALLAAIVESSDDAILSKKLDGTILSWNRGAENIFGYTQEEILGRHVSILIPQELLKEEEFIVGQLARGKSIEHFETVRLHKNGGKIDVSLTVHPIRDPAGNVVAASKVVRDISARKHIEAKLRAVVDHAVDGLITIDAIGTVETFNPACERIFGFASSDVIGKNVRMLMPEPSQSRHDEYLSRYASTGEARIIGKAGREVSGMRKDGSVFPMDLSVSAFELDDGVHFSGIVRDITLRKHADQTLRDQANLLDLSHDGVLVRELDGTIRFWNQGAEEVYGYSKQQAEGKISHLLLGTVFPQPLEEIEAHLMQYGRWEGELEHHLQNGSPIVVESRWVVQHLGAGLPPRIMESNNDITPRKRAEAEALRYTEALERSNQELDEFAFAASHDLKAPLRVISNAIQWIDEDLAEHHTAESKENMVLVWGRVRRMEKLLEDLLEYSRIGRVMDARYRETITVDRLLEEILELTPPPPGFIVSPHSSLIGVQVRRMPLQHILMNLIANAVKHHDKKCGLIEISVEDIGGRYLFAVKDDGPGIPAKFHAQIFKMFQTLKPRDQVEGSGMGLAMVQKHLHTVGGEIKLESSEGQGCNFQFTWPKSQSS